jgi:quercetin dioxygenase-like cupin family protein
VAEPAILHPSDIPVVDRGGGARTTPLVCCEIGARGLLNGITEFDPGAGIPLHYHNCEETVIILEGQATFEVDGREYELKALDTTWVPAGMHHRFRNQSGGRMRIFWTYSSIDATRTVVATGQTFKIGSAEDRAPSRPTPNG